MKPQISPELRELVSAAQEDAPSDAALSRLADTIQKGSSAASRSGSSVLPPVFGRTSALTIAAACAVVAGMFALTVSDFGKPVQALPVADTSSELTPAPAAAPPQTESPSTHPFENTDDMPAIDVHALPNPEKRPEARARVGVVANSASESPSEGALLRRAHEAITTDPRQALHLTAEHALRFPAGMLVQEREVIAIEALSHMGRMGEARQRAATFFRTYPSSAYRSRVNEALGVPATRLPSSAEAQ